jgi:hypothetical protein
MCFLPLEGNLPGREIPEIGNRENRTRVINDA